MKYQKITNENIKNNLEMFKSIEDVKQIIN